jgi:hypothetical protein
VRGGGVCSFEIAEVICHLTWVDNWLDGEISEMASFTEPLSGYEESPIWTSSCKQRGGCRVAAAGGEHWRGARVCRRIVKRRASRFHAAVSIDFLKFVIQTSFRFED